MGHKQGVQEGTERMSHLMKQLFQEKRYDEIEKALNDQAYCEELIKKYNL